MAPDSAGTVNEGFQWIENRTNLEKTPPGSTRPYRLERMRRLAALAGNPQDSFQTIHLAGSKGKGSTGVIAASLLEASGRPCGLYTSPHAADYRERITRAGRFFPEEIYAAGLEELRRITDQLKSDTEGSPPGRAADPTTFELLTLLAWLIFRRAGLDWVVLETGLGGRLDATNIITAPQAVIITPIEREHTEILGSTLEEIAGEKAGIIKPRAPVFTSRQHPAAAAVLRSRARLQEAPLTPVPQQGELEIRDISPDGTSLRWTKPPLSAVARLPLLGPHQAENAQTALAAVTALLPALSPDALRRGLEEARLPGRFQSISRRPAAYLDGGHTPAAARRAVETLELLHPPPWILLFGAVSGKDIEGMARELASRFSEILVTKPGTFRSSNPAAAADCFREIHPQVWLEEDPRRAWRLALEKAGTEGVILILGSFYLAGALLDP